MLLQIVHYNAPILHKKGDRITVFDAALARLASDMVETMQAAVTADQQAAARRLARYEKRLRLDKIAVTTVLLRGDPSPLILEQTGKLRVAFVVMGSHGHGTITGRLVGTTTEYILRRARCPVIVVSHPKFKEAPAGAS